MGSSTEWGLFEVPADVEFPLELNCHLKEKLHAYIQENVNLHKHIEFLDSEVLELRRFKVQHKTKKETCCHCEQKGGDGDAPAVPYTQNESILATKLVELNTKNRDMTAQVESLKTKLKKLYTDNTQLRAELKSAQASSSSRGDQTGQKVDKNKQNDCKSTSDEILTLKNQLGQTKAKMMQYRLQTQQLKLELKNAQKALSDEVGDGQTVSTIASFVATPGWRGRAQQILALQQKVSDLQSKLAFCEHGHGPIIHSPISCMNYVENCRLANSSTAGQMIGAGEGPISLPEITGPDSAEVIVDCPKEFKDSFEQSESLENKVSFDSNIEDFPVQQGGLDYAKSLGYSEADNNIHNEKVPNDKCQREDSLSIVSHNNNNGNQGMSTESEYGAVYGYEKAPSVRSSCSSLFPTNASVISQPSRHLQFQQKRKNERIEALNGELSSTKSTLTNTRTELKACKARISTLESQIKSMKYQVDSTEAKAKEKEEHLNQISNELRLATEELIVIRDREKKLREKYNGEVTEAQRSLTKERSVIVSLQKVITEKQNCIQSLDEDLSKAKAKLESCSASVGGLSLVDRVQGLEIEVKELTKGLEAGEKERSNLMKLLNDAMNSNDEERQKYSQAQSQLSRTTVVLHRANECINELLEASDITNERILKNVEEIKTLTRELKTGALYSLEQGAGAMGDPRKLKTRINVLNKDISDLQSQVKQLGLARKKDLQKYVFLSDQVKNDFFQIIESLKKKYG